jgi:hypothetical protein
MGGMETTDRRSLSRDARHERRVQVIRPRAAGHTYEAIAAQTGLSRTGARRRSCSGRPAWLHADATALRLWAPRCPLGQAPAHQELAFLVADELLALPVNHVELPIADVS